MGLFKDISYICLVLELPYDIDGAHAARFLDEIQDEINNLKI